MDAQVMEKLETALPVSDGAIARDLKLNLRRLLAESALDETERLLALAVSARIAGAPLLERFSKETLLASGLDAAAVQEAEDVPAIMAMLNTYYRFRHMIGTGEPEYGPTGLRMASLSKPALGKERFEMLAFVASVLNGCERCIRSHEKVLRDAGVSVAKLHDLARIAAIARGLAMLVAK